MKTALAWSAPIWFFAFVFSMISYGASFNRGYKAGQNIHDMDYARLQKVVSRMGVD